MGKHSQGVAHSWGCPRLQRSLPLAVAGLLAAALLLQTQGVRAEDMQTLLNQWNQFRSKGSKLGIRLETVNTTDVLSNVRGGVARRTDAPGNIDLMLTVDAEKTVGWKGGTLFVYGLGDYGNNPSRDVGDLQGVSNVAAPNTWKLFEAWYQHNFFQEKLSVLAGLYDVTSEFQVIRDASELFLNSSFGTTPEFALSGRNGLSSFPTTAVGLRVQAKPVDNWAFRAAVLDGVPGDTGNSKGTQISFGKDDGFFAGAELAYEFEDEKLAKAEGSSGASILKVKPRRKARRRIGRAAPLVYDGKYAVGIWGYSTTLNDLNDVDSAGTPIQRHGTYGFYGIAERRVYKEPDDPLQGLTLFGQVGFADPRVNRIASYQGGGAVYTGLIPGRDKDQIGFGVAAAHNSGQYESAQRNAGIPVTNAEITLEFTYAALLTEDPELALQPDIQYVINPGTNPSLKNALVIGVRIEASLEWLR